MGLTNTAYKVNVPVYHGFFLKVQCLTGRVEKAAMFWALAPDILNAPWLETGIQHIPLRIHGTGIFTYIWFISMVNVGPFGLFLWKNVGKYTIHGSFGYWGLFGGFLKMAGFPNKPMDFPTKNDPFGVWNGGYHHFRKHPYWMTH